jgi:hypothetical protein
MKSAYYFFLLLLIIFPACATLNVESQKLPTGQAKPLVLVELYTSQGCISCPPADRLLAQMEKEQPNANAEIVTLALHVDYWNSVVWKDEYSSPIFSRRQDIYAQRFKINRIFTPQMIVDGQTQFVGNNAETAGKAITESAKIEKANIELEKAENNLKVKISNLQNREMTTIFLAVTEDKLSANIKGGENANRKLEYNSVVRELKSIGIIPPAQNNFEADVVLQLQPAWKKENLKFVIFAQENGSRKILGVNRVNAE